MQSFSKWPLLVAALLLGTSMAYAAPKKKEAVKPEVKAPETKGEWSFKPSIYSRGGLTYTHGLSNLSQRGIPGDTFNLGSYADETDAIRPNLTEAQIVFSYKNKIRYTYGFDVDNDRRMANGNNDRTELNERLNFLEYLDGNYTYWFGKRAYRGDGEYLTGKWFLDELNIFGGGVRIEKITPKLNTEFAFGSVNGRDNLFDFINLNARVNDPPEDITIRIPAETNVTRPENVFVNKIEYPMANGKIKSNLEIHRVNANLKNERSYSYVIGGEYQRWGDKLGGGSLYNRFILNYSHGPIGAGMMTVVNNPDKNNHPSKILLAWNGDYKNNALKVYYNAVFQRHASKNVKTRWTTLDLYLRPMYNVKGNFYAGIDYAGRVKSSRTNVVQDQANAWQSAKVHRYALMGEYKPNWQDTSFRVLIGRINSKAVRPYTTGGNKKNASFIRLGYEVSIN